MDDTSKTGMTEFLRREVRAWESAEVLGARRTDRHKRRILMIVAAVSAAVLAVALCIWLIPRNAEKPPEGEGGHDGGVPPTEQTGEPDTQTEPESELGQTVPESPLNPYAYDFTVVPAGATPIVPVDLRAENNPVNMTDRVIDMNEVLAAACRIPAIKGQVSVLILHTHTGEGYNESDAAWLDADDEEFARSYDGNQSVVAMGAEIAAALNAAGIGTVHCKTVFDGQSNRESYQRAADAILAFCKAYPFLVCVIDVHRAAVTDADGNIVRSLAVKDGQGIAQTQIVCGMGAEKTSKTNLALAMNLYDGMNAAFPGSCAAVVCKEQTLNQDLVPFSLTLEIGSCGNTPAQAKAAAKIAAAALSPLFDLN